jgi:hypothetical protein
VFGSSTKPDVGAIRPVTDWVELNLAVLAAPLYTEGAAVPCLSGTPDATSRQDPELKPLL